MAKTTIDIQGTELAERISELGSLYGPDLPEHLRQRAEHLAGNARQAFELRRECGHFVLMPSADLLAAVASIRAYRNALDMRRGR